LLQFPCQSTMSAATTNGLPSFLPESLHRELLAVSQATLDCPACTFVHEVPSPMEVLPRLLNSIQMLLSRNTFLQILPPLVAYFVALIPYKFILNFILYMC
jgi:hypothetical protein